MSIFDYDEEKEQEKEKKKKKKLDRNLDTICPQGTPRKNGKTS